MHASLSDNVYLFTFITVETNKISRVSSYIVSILI